MRSERLRAGEELKNPDAFLKPGAYAENSLGDKPTSTNGNLANTIDTLFWTYVNPASPFRHNPEVLARFLRRAHFYMEGVEPLADQVLSTKKGYLDEFALGPVSAPLREDAQLFPKILLPTQRRLWDRVLRKAADAQLRRQFHPPGHRTFPSPARQLRPQERRHLLDLAQETHFRHDRYLYEKMTGCKLCIDF